VLKTFRINGELRTEEEIDAKELIHKIMKSLKNEGLHYEGVIEPREINSEYT